MVGMLAEILERHAGAVRSGLQVDPVVAERGPDVVQVLGGQSARVETEIRVALEATPAFAHRLLREEIPQGA